MKLWYPNRKQWWVIWFVTVPVLIGWISLGDTFNREQGERFLVSLLVIGGLLMWRFKNRGAGPQV